MDEITIEQDTNTDTNVYSFKTLNSIYKTKGGNAIYLDGTTLKSNEFSYYNASGDLMVVAANNNVLNMATPQSGHIYYDGSSFSKTADLDTAIGDDLTKRGYSITYYGDDPKPVDTRETRDMVIAKPDNR